MRDLIQIERKPFVQEGHKLAKFTLLVPGKKIKDPRQYLFTDFSLNWAEYLR
jgi:hypothetical protein